jgi:glyoxylase-like metal-dependent hydrolase (beta-lactamase superfamily II)
MYVIRPLKQAVINAGLAAWMMGADPRVPVAFPVYIWVIEGNGMKLVVDAGIEEHDPASPHPIEGGGENALREALGKANLQPEKVDLLILTHLHPDHAAYAKLFHNARIVVQKREWETAFNPPIPLRRTYYQRLISPLEGMDICLVDGDVEIVKGIKLVLLPGHTPGLQGVAVETKEGTYLLSSDHFFIRYNISPPKQPAKLQDSHGNIIEIPPFETPFVPPAMPANLIEWYNSCFKALSITRRSKIIPGHDPSITDKKFP